MKNPKRVSHKNGIDIYMFKPSVFSLYWYGYDEIDQPDYWKQKNHRLRMLKLLFVNKYRVVYGIKDGVVVGHMVVSRNKNEFEGATKRDIVVGPKWTAPSCRGLGYGTIILKSVLDDELFDFEDAYEMISSVNYPSIRVAEKCGYQKVSNARRAKHGKVKYDDGGSWCVYRYSKNQGCEMI